MTRRRTQLSSRLLALFHFFLALALAHFRPPPEARTPPETAPGLSLRIQDLRHSSPSNEFAEPK